MRIISASRLPVRRLLGVAVASLTMPLSVLEAQRLLDRGQWVRARSSNGVVFRGKIASAGFAAQTSDSLRVSIPPRGRGVVVLARSDTTLSVPTADLTMIEIATDRGQLWVRAAALAGLAGGAALGSLAALSTPIDRGGGYVSSAIGTGALGGFLIGLTSGQMSRLRWEPYWRRDAATPR